LLSSSLPLSTDYTGNGLSRQSLFFLYALILARRCFQFITGDKENQENSDGDAALKNAASPSIFLF